MQRLRLARLLTLLFSVYLLTSAMSSAQTFTTLLSFDKTDGVSPLGPLILGPGGDFYGTTGNGGTDDFGTFFKITTKGDLTTLYTFLCSPPVCADGYNPQAIALGSDGNFYGVTYNGGINSGGTVFKITPQGALTTLYSFCSQPACTDGQEPNGPLVMGRDGNFYGTTYSGGSAGGTGGAGTIFKITTNGTLTTLYSFCSQSHCADGQLPVTGLIQSRDGNFYGTTPYGGADFYGVAFKITPAGTLTVLHSFDQTDGANPQSPLLLGTNGYFYGMTYEGGSSGNGTVFRMSSTGKLTTLADFDGTNGENPYVGGLVELGGNFYGTTLRGGANQMGTAFKVTPRGAVTVLYNFCSVGGGACNDGAAPNSIALAPTGIFFGTTELGGTSNDGTLFQLSVFTGSVEISPASGDIGATVAITGSGLSGATAISFNGTPAKFTVINSSEMTTSVPSGSVSGSVIVTAKGGALVSDVPFLVDPQIESFTPESGRVGKQVTITGLSLTQTTGVAFGGVAATAYRVASDTKVIATVPADAQTGPISVSTQGGSTTSTTSFTVSN